MPLHFKEILTSIQQNKCGIYIDSFLFIYVLTFILNINRMESDVYFFSYMNNSSFQL